VKYLLCLFPQYVLDHVTNLLSCPSPCLFIWHIGASDWTQHVEFQDFGPWVQNSGFTSTAKEYIRCEFCILCKRCLESGPLYFLTHSLMLWMGVVFSGEFLKMSPLSGESRRSRIFICPNHKASLLHWLSKLPAPESV
jgi:hypothetical protein